MIDLHCHVLPSLDDGAVDMADSVAMARIAAADGVTHICATPHIRHDHDVRVHELARRVRDVNLALEREQVDVTILAGGEVAETALAGLDDGELDQVSLGGGRRWILLEPAPGPLSDSLEAAVEQLAESGRGAVVAHPERHAGADFHDRLRGLIARGALIQATAAALLEDSTAPTVVELARDGLVHLLGSDAHSARYGRPAALARAFEVLERHGSRVAWMRDVAPAAIVAGEPVELERP